MGAPGVLQNIRHKQLLNKVSAALPSNQGSKARPAPPSNNERQQVVTISLQLYFGFQSLKGLSLKLKDHCNKRLA